MSVERVDLDKCIGCRECVATCPMDVMRIDEETSKAIIAYQDDCQICHLCSSYCSESSITISAVRHLQPVVSWG